MPAPALTGLSGLSGMVGGEGGAFSPDDVSGLLVWAEADMTGADLTLNGSNIINWGDADLTQFTQGTDSKRFALTSGEAIPDGADDNMTSAATIGVSTFSVFHVMRVASLISDFYLYDSRSPTNGFYFLNANTVLYFSCIKGGVQSRKKSATLLGDLQGSMAIIRHDYGGSHATHKVYVNGAEETLADQNTGEPGSGSTTVTVALGSHNNTTQNFFKDRINASLIYSPVLSAGDSLSVESYLNDKWSVF